MLVYIFTAILFVRLASTDDRIDFDYTEGVGSRTPFNWSTFYPTCGGNRQSPVDIPANLTTIRQSGLVFNNFLTEPSKIELIHMLHTPLVKYHMDCPITVRGGPFDENTTYVFDHYNIRWGQNSSNGSEHALGGKYFAGEMQFIFYDNTTDGFHDAVLREDGIAVFSVWLEEVPSLDNSYFNELLAMLDYVTKPWSYTDLCEMIPLKYYFPYDTLNFFAYKGSLTYPPCPETVTWVVFLETVPISSYQLLKLRRMIGPKGPIQTNRRPIQSAGKDHQIVRVETSGECG